MPNASHDQRWPIGPRASSQRWIVELLRSHPKGLTVDQIIALRALAHRRPNASMLLHGLRRLRSFGFAGRRLLPHPPYYVWLLSPAGRDLVNKDSRDNQAQG